MRLPGAAVLPGVGRLRGVHPSGAGEAVCLLAGSQQELTLPGVGNEPEISLKGTSRGFRVWMVWILDLQSRVGKPPNPAVQKPSFS